MEPERRADPRRSPPGTSSLIACSRSGRHQRPEPTRRPPRRRSGSPTARSRPGPSTVRQAARISRSIASSDPGRDPEGHGVRLDRRPVPAHRAAARPHQASVGARVTAVAVDLAPDRRHRLEHRPTRLGVLLGGQPAERRSAGRSSRRRTESTAAACAVASVDSGPRPGDAGPRRSSPPSVDRAPGVGSSSSSHGSAPRMFARLAASSPSTSCPAPSPVELAVEARAGGSVASRERTRRTRRADPPARLASAPRRRSPNAASSSPKDRSSLRAMLHAPEDTPTRGRALSPCAHADPLPRWRDDRHRLAVPARHRACSRPHRLRDVPGQPERLVRNRIPFAFEPADLDAVLLTHAHLDHCGLIPLLVRGGFRGPIHATAGTVELATLVLLDSGQLHEEFAKREARWEKRHPDEVEADDRQRSRRIPGCHRPGGGRWRRAQRDAPPGRGAADAAGRRRPRRRASRARPDDHRARARTRRPTDRLAARSRGRPARPAAAPRDRPRRRRSTRPRTPSASLAQFTPVHYDQEVEVAPGIHATFVDAGHILGSAIIRVRVQDQDGGEERIDRLLGRPRPARHADPARPDDH